MVIDGTTRDPSHAYNPLIGSILPRAIGSISILSVARVGLGGGWRSRRGQRDVRHRDAAL